MNLDPLFSPTRRLQAIWEEVHDVDHPFLYVEEMLVVPAEVFLDIRWYWDDLWGFISVDVRRKFLWLTDDTFIAVGDISEIFGEETPYDTLLIASSTTTSGQDQTLTLIKEMDAGVSTEACFVFWRAIETNKSARIKIQGDDNYPSQLPAGPILSQLLKGRPLHQGLDFCEFSFMEEHCRALAGIQRTDLNITLNDCALVPQHAQEIFIQWFRHNQIVTELNRCSMESSILSALISGNNSLRKLSFAREGHFGRERLIALTEALLTNHSIEDLRVSPFSLNVEESNLNVEECSLLFRSLSTHPQIKSLSIWTNSYIVSNHNSKITDVMQAILRMLRLNTVMHTLRLPAAFNNEEVYQNLILPRLEMNRSCFEMQRQAVKQADPSIRPQLLGRALHVVRYNPELVFRFLSENVPAFVRTEEEEYVASLEQDHVLGSVAGQKRKASA
jgi:hypothetical protein